jgi:hypothetical protein
VPTFHVARFRATLPLERVMLWTALNGENRRRLAPKPPGWGSTSDIGFFTSEVEQRICATLRRLFLMVGDCA